MTKEDVIAAVEPIHKGSFIHVEYEKIIPTGSGIVHKITSWCARIKFAYTNMKSVSKSTGTTKLPDWKSWDTEHSYLLNYTGTNSAKKGTTYLRLGATGCANHRKTVKYVFNDIELTEATHSSLLATVKSLDRDNSEPIRDIDIKNVIKIGK